MADAPRRYGAGRSSRTIVESYVVMHAASQITTYIFRSRQSPSCIRAEILLPKSTNNNCL